MHPFLYNRLFLPAYSRVRGNKSLAAYHELRAHDRLSAEQVHAIATTKLQSLVGYVA